ncbi:hypothetical protein DMH12_01395 [Streptomyces sp. WAC 04229]|nr:hypothetical protein DMH12_01395 [Streptomyces sp. WAC 04229]
MPKRDPHPVVADRAARLRLRLPRLRGQDLTTGPALPVITVLRRRPPRITDRAHAWTYVALLGAVTVAMVV